MARSLLTGILLALVALTSAACGHGADVTDGPSGPGGKGDTLDGKRVMIRPSTEIADPLARRLPAGASKISVRADERNVSIEGHYWRFDLDGLRARTGDDKVERKALALDIDAAGREGSGFSEFAMLLWTGPSVEQRRPVSCPGGDGTVVYFRSPKFDNVRGELVQGSKHYPFSSCGIDNVSTVWAFVVPYWASPLSGTHTFKITSQFK